MCNHPPPVLTEGFRQTDESPFHPAKYDPDSDAVLELTQHSSITMSGSKDRRYITRDSRMPKKSSERKVQRAWTEQLDSTLKPNRNFFLQVAG